MRLVTVGVHALPTEGDQSRRLAPTLQAAGRAVFGLGKVYLKKVRMLQLPHAVYIGIRCVLAGFAENARESCEVLRGRCRLLPAVS